MIEYAETVVLGLILDDNLDEAYAMLRDFHPGELQTLRNACLHLESLISDVEALATTYPYPATTETESTTTPPD